ncbi:class I adenylate-forming enzyme family protein [Haladaptatus cibarius]|uniref:class I adenylate-forming enzyme family protein n=1 Tax=Haladaptatus cibarius TaxID=453847 RepID=UPI000678A736|nr:AMP-binding protein [Haladaptatus cibarius]
MSLSFERHADLWGNRVAVVEGNEEFTYTDFARRVKSVANELSELGISSDDRVAVVSRNRVEVLVLLFATWRGGGVFAPVSHRLTPATVSTPMERIDPDIVLFESAQRDLVRQFDAHSFEEIEHERPAIDGEPAEAGESTAAAVDSPHANCDQTATIEKDDTCLLVSTDDGENVVRLSRRAVEWNSIAAVSGFGLGRTDCTLPLLPLSLSDCLFRFVLPLLTVGGCVVLQRAFDPERALAAIEQHGVSCLDGGPTEFQGLADVDGKTNRDSLRSLSSLDWLTTRARVPPDVREAFPVPFVRVYGRPETGLNVLRESPGNERTAHPFPDCDVRIEDETGELFVRGATTAGGYLDGKRFGDWVPTGDLFRRENGEGGGNVKSGESDGDESAGFVFVGRADEPFESEGKRIHPRAIETVLESHPDVRSAGAIEGVAETGGAAPKAVVVGDASPGELREFAEERLAQHEVPRAIEVVASLPRRATGELNRAELRTRFGGG